MMNRCGYTRGFIERSEILKVLHKNLPEASRQKKVLPNKRISKIDHALDGVTVHCTDGSSYRGDIVAGADGVKSKVRSEMWRASNESDHRVPETEQEPAKATFSCLFGISTSLHELGFHPRHFDVIPDRGHSIMWMTNEDKIFWYVCKTLPKPLAPGEQKFTDADAEALAEDLKDCPVMPNGRATFKDLWNSRTTAILLPTEMGEHKTVAWNRFALLGDSVHKQTISAGQGGNLCMESAAALTNVIKHLLDNTPGRKPTVEEIDQALVGKYMTPRATRVAEYVQKVNGHTALICKYSLPLRIISEYLMPIMPSDAGSSFFSDLEVGADFLDFLPPPKAALKGTMPFNKLFGAGQRESILKRAKWALPLLGLFLLARNKMDGANGGPELMQLLESGKITGALGQIEIFQSFYGITAIDNLLKFVTTFCAGWTPGFDEKSYWQVLTFFPDYGLATAIIYLESFRSANSMTLAKL
jgi:2-polyprenyl-6-methoxyphenol hydroxylase-like FAD-dependent oxidoreductase